MYGCDQDVSRFNDQKVNARQRRSLFLRTEAFVKAQVTKRAADYRFLVEDDNTYVSPEDELAIFHRDEVQISDLLGVGTFSEVHQISGFRLSNLMVNPAREHTRERIQATTHDGQTEYVLKHLQKDLSIGRSNFLKAATNIVLEAKFLSKLNHPNIIKIRGWAGESACFTDNSCDGFFLILDKLDETLSERIERWKIEEELSEQSYLGPRAQDLVTYQEKLNFALQIANALDYLHDRDIMFRDLKPDNIGFKGKTVQIFDFGLIRQLPEESPHEYQLFQMSGIGTRRYTAPEVMNGEGYNAKADVYSWTMVLYSMLALTKPFDGYSPPLHKWLVCEEAIRPALFPHWPDEIQELFQSGWAHCHRDRPSIKQICMKVSSILNPKKIKTNGIHHSLFYHGVLKEDKAYQQF